MERRKNKKRGVIIITIIFSMHMCGVCICVHVCEFTRVCTCVCIHVCMSAVLACAHRCKRLNDIGRLLILPSKLFAETDSQLNLKFSVFARLVSQQALRIQLSVPPSSTCATDTHHCSFVLWVMRYKTQILTGEQQTLCPLIHTPPWPERRYYNKAAN